MPPDNSLRIKELIDIYGDIVKNVDDKAVHDGERAYGGRIRAEKGTLVENLCKKMVEIAWSELGGEPERLSLEKQTTRIPLNKAYLERIKSQEVKEYIEKNIQDFFYTLKTDVHVYVDRQFIIGIECKAYTENAMLKRILVDFTLFKQIYPNLRCVLMQLESQLGGDYSNLGSKTTYGSGSTHTLLSYFDIDLVIITLLEGERKVDKPIHKPAYYKELEQRNLLGAVEVFKDLLRNSLIL